MTNRFIPAAVLALTLGFGSNVLAQSTAQPDLNAVVATVNGVEIKLGHIAVARSTLPQQYQSLPVDVLFAGILDQLIQQTALSQSFEGERPDRIALALENESRSLLAGEVVESVLSTAVTEGALTALYEETYAGESGGQEFNAAHILVETEEAALQIQEDINNGADFADTAREKSTGPSGPSGGDLGWFGLGAMVPSFEAVVVELETGEVSAPVETQFGWHVIKLVEKRLKEAPALEEVRADLEQQIRNEAVQAHIDKLTAAADVDRAAADAMDPSVLDQIDLTIQP